MKSTARNPKLIESTIARIEAITEKNPFTAHAQATYSRGWTSSSEIAHPSPSGVELNLGDDPVADGNDRGEDSAGPESQQRDSDDEIPE